MLIPSHRILATASIALLGAGLLAGCATEQNSPGQQNGTQNATVLTYASGDAEPTCLDPHVGGNFPQALLASQYLEQLLTKDDQGQIVPWLATTYEFSPDGLHLSLNIKPDVVFHDGTPLNAEAVKTTLEHIKDPATGSSTGYLALASIDTITIDDELALTLNLSYPDRALLDSLTQPWVAIESPKALEAGIDANCLAPKGTGPYEVSEWVKNESVTLVRNDNYNSAPPTAKNDSVALEKIIWRFIPESATRYAALTSGEVAIIDNAQPDTIVAAQNADGISVYNAPRPGAANRLELNSSKAPFDEVNVRQAFIRAANPGPGIESLFFGTAKQSYSPLSSVEPFGYSDSALFAPDTKLANQLLDAAGWVMGDDGVRVRDGVRLTLDLPVSTNQSIPAEQSLFEQIQHNVAEVGFELKLHPMDLGSWYAELAAHNYNLVSAPYTKVGPDVLRILYHSDSTIPAPSGYFANLAQVKDPQVDAWLIEARTTADPDAAKQLYQKVQEKVLTGYYLLPLYDQQNQFLASDRVSDLQFGPVGTPLLGSVRLAK